jgi:lipid II:glycine glycyltransferase (peptidoglycan interpeptide bridge formation enzyme)
MDKESWTEVLGKFQDASIYQTWSYGDIRWGRKNLQHIVLKKENDIVAAVQMVIKKIPIINTGVAYTYLGPMWRRHGNENIELFEDILSTINTEYAIKNNYVIRIVPMVSDENADIMKLLEKKGYVRNTDKKSYRTIILDLKGSLDDIRKSFKQKWRNQLNAAEKNKLTVIDGDGEELYRIFLTMQKEMISRKKYRPGVDYNEFREIQNDLPPNQKMKIFICSYDGEPVSAAIVSAIGNTGIYLLGATGEKGLKVKGSYLLQWKIVQWLKSIQCEWYDLGGINPDSNPGVYLFKSGLSGKDTKYIGIYEFSKHKSLIRLLNLFDRIKK